MAEIVVVQGRPLHTWIRYLAEQLLHDEEPSHTSVGVAEELCRIADDLTPALIDGSPGAHRGIDRA